MVAEGAAGPYCPAQHCCHPCLVLLGHFGTAMAGRLNIAHWSLQYVRVSGTLYLLGSGLGLAFIRLQASAILSSPARLPLAPLSRPAAVPAILAYASLPSKSGAAIRAKAAVLPHALFRPGCSVPAAEGLARARFCSWLPRATVLAKFAVVPPAFLHPESGVPAAQGLAQARFRGRWRRCRRWRRARFDRDGGVGEGRVRVQPQLVADGRQAAPAARPEGVGETCLLCLAQALTGSLAVHKAVGQAGLAAVAPHADRRGEDARLRRWQRCRRERGQGRRGRHHRRPVGRRDARLDRDGGVGEGRVLVQPQVVARGRQAAPVARPEGIVEASLVFLALAPTRSLVVHEAVRQVGLAAVAPHAKRHWNDAHLRRWQRCRRERSQGRGRIPWCDGRHHRR